MTNFQVQYYNKLYISRKDYLWMIWRLIWVKVSVFLLHWIWLLPLLGPLGSLSRADSIQMHIGELIGRIYFSGCFLFMASLIMNSGKMRYLESWVELVQRFDIGWFQLKACISFSSYRLKYSKFDTDTKQYYFDVVHRFGEKNELTDEFVMRFMSEKHNIKFYTVETFDESGTICRVASLTEDLLFHNRNRRIDFVPQERLILVHTDDDGLEKHFSEIRKRARELTRERLQ